MWMLDKMLRSLIKRGSFTLLDHDGKAYRYGTPDPELKSVTARLTDPGAAMHIARDPRTGAGEAYMDGRLVVEEGDIRDLVYLIRANADQFAGAELDPPNPLRRMLGQIAGRLDRLNYKRRARRNAAHSYDLSRRLFQLFLDEDMQYTCAYWRDTDISLEQAQRDKKAHIAAKLNLKPGLRILDVGCGWGGLALYLHQVSGAEVLGIALAEEQIKLARERAAAAGVSDKVRFELMDYRDVTGRFDRITDVGFLEHVGPPQFRSYLGKCEELLAPDGVMLSHFIGRVGPPGVTDKWTAKYIFPGGYIPALSEVVSASERCNLRITDIETLRRHYGYTLEQWYRRTVEHRDEIVALYDERFFRMWQFYLVGAETAFHHGSLVNYQIQYTKSRDALPITRDYMMHEEQRLRALTAEEQQVRAAAE
jgi:cyclopropane-fatty-acyl-phospholipid synthase